MPNTILSANMSLPVPVVGTDPGPQYASDINSALTILDAHTHAAGSGVLITPAAININSALTLNNNLLTNIQALTLTPQVSNAGIFSIFSKGVDFYLTDGSSNVIRLTQGGSVAGSTGTITGLPSGTASASFAASTFTFQSATNTAAIIDGRDHIFRLSSASSNALTLSPPAGLSGGSYQLFLPTVPVSTSVMTLDTSGNIGTTVDPSINTLTVNTITATTIGATDITASTVLIGSRSAVTSVPFTATSSMCRGQVTTALSGSSADGTYSWVRGGTNNSTATIFFTTFFGAAPIVTATVDNTSGSFSQTVCSIGATNGSLTTVITVTSTSGTFTNNPFYFIAIGAR